MDGILKDILLYLFILFVLTTTAYTAQDPQMFQQNEAVKKDILNGLYVQNSSHDTKELSQITDFLTFFEYVNYTVLPTLYPKYCFLDTHCDSNKEKWISNGVIWRLRHLQLRQLRAKRSGTLRVNKLAHTCRNALHNSHMQHSWHCFLVSAG